MNYHFITKEHGDLFKIFQTLITLLLKIDINKIFTTIDV